MDAPLPPWLVPRRSLSGARLAGARQLSSCPPDTVRVHSRTFSSNVHSYTAPKTMYMYLKMTIKLSLYSSAVFREVT